ncbi:glycoside hydrolase family 2 [Phycicoccus sp. BSK3Z-2]|uniref:Glycoside hydrolase family 2 n=1 Tax=Phycicoccus avicenniae TaxID=2828860 RepID=A0A941D458_9MICO|nr:glycoside hydrolase family 2 TIM barrel-domain containing protein [Phycicoccus avicenniae]MBR7741774.1 glycoside hydrolase family 2 [Phycicoccus avicenniae]
MSATSTNPTVAEDHQDAPFRTGVSRVSAVPTDYGPASPHAATTEHPRPEYPRPDRDRSQRWMSLNGPWDLRVEDETIQVLVPFSWETQASGIGRTWVEHATYRRRFDVPDWGGMRTVLCFGAVHHRADVRLDGVLVASHEGGHTSFEVDVTDQVAGRPSVDLVVDVAAPADKRQIPHGKQRSVPRDDYDGVSFTPTSGIWQSVWLEGRARTYVEQLEIRGDSLTGFDLQGRLAGDAASGETPVIVAVTSGSDASEAVELVPDDEGTFSGRLDITTPRLWAPADPHLYSLTVTTAGDDTSPGELVTYTAGLRSIAADGGHLTLNGERLYVRGVLDQGYWPETGMTAPDDTALVADLELAKELGYNLVRKHIKLEDPRWLHHADRLGVLVWAEPPGPSRWSLDAARRFEDQLAPMVERDGNHPCIVIWGLYNEEWGLDWNIPGSDERASAAVSAYDLLRSLDDTRPVVDNSGWAHVRTDLVDWHYYDEDPAAWATNVAGLADGSRETFPVRLGPDYLVDKALYSGPQHPRTGLPLLNSEYGAGFTSLERGWHLRWQTQELRRHDRFAGYVYTELTDVEHEMAGIVDADRRPKDHGGVSVADVNARTVLVIDLVPAAAGADLPPTDDPVRLDVHVSHHGGRAHIRVAGSWAPYGQPVPPAPAEGSTHTEATEVWPFVLSEPSTITLPEPPAVMCRAHLWALDEDGTVLARAYVDVAPVEAANRP